ncbi:MAG: dephospho-CoA kinase [Verrucomicrobiia bacterium]
MPVLGITGGVASGKSSFVRCLMDRRSFELFDADKAVHKLLEGEAAPLVIDRFGLEVVNEAGGIKRSALRDKVLEDSVARVELEAILHPMVRRQWKAQVEEFRSQSSAYRGCNLLVLDIPLLFEVQAESDMDLVVVVGCQSKTQRRRLIETRGFDETTADRFMAMQWPIEEKLTRGDFVVWNDGPFPLLNSQADLLMEIISVYD